MSIYRRGSGRYIAVIAKSEGSTERRSLGTFATKKEAEKAERDALAARDRGVELAPQGTTLSDVFAAFIAEAEADGLSGTTLRNYRETFRRCESVAAVRVSKIKSSHLAALRATLLSSGWSGGKGALSPRSVRNTTALVTTLLSWAVENELIVRNVTAITRSRRNRRRGTNIAKRPTRHYERDEALLLIREAAKTRYAPLIVFAFESGLRRGELAGLRWEDVNLDGQVATIRNSVAQIPRKKWLKDTKTHLVADVPLSEHAIEALRAQHRQQAKDKLAAGQLYDDQGFVFAPAEGGMPSPAAMYSAVALIAKRVGLPLHNLHGMRHSAGSWLINAGVPLPTVQAYLRHSSAVTTMGVYAHDVKGATAEATRHLLGASLPTGTEGPER